MNTKKTPCLLIVSIIVLSSLSHAQMELPEPESIVESMMKEQGVLDAAQLDCSRITDEEFQLLGDSVMDKMAGNPELHERMDQMMGGEGSASLRRAHIAMGQNWLGCLSGNSNFMMPMMMQMMGSYYPAYYSGYDAVLLLAAIGWVLFLIFFLYSYQKKRR